MVLLLGEDNSILIAAILIGTILGLLVKYVLDRKWIFKEPKTSIKINSKKFSIYSLMNIYYSNFLVNRNHFLVHLANQRNA